MSAPFVQPTESDADLILFYRLTGEKSGSVWTYNVATGEETRLTPDLHNARNWSPDGSRILISEALRDDGFPDARLLVMDGDGQNHRLLTDSYDVYPGTAAWSTDGTRIIFWGIDLQVVVGQPRWAIYDVPVTGSPTRRLTKHTARNGGLAIAPDGSQIIFTQDGRLYKLPANGGEPTTLDVPIRIGLLSWSPDGTMLAGTGSGSLGTGIYVFGPDGSNLRLLDTDGLAGHVSWSPDSKEILFITDSAGGWSPTLAIVNIETNRLDTYHVGEGALEPLAAITRAVWSPDGTQIALTGRYRENNPYDSHTSIYMVDQEVTYLQRLTDSELNDSVVQWRPRP